MLNWSNETHFETRPVPRLHPGQNSDTNGYFGIQMDTHELVLLLHRSSFCRLPCHWTTQPNDCFYSRKIIFVCLELFSKLSAVVFSSYDRNPPQGVSIIRNHLILLWKSQNVSICVPDLTRALNDCQTGTTSPVCGDADVVPPKINDIENV